MNRLIRSPARVKPKAIVHDPSNSSSTKVPILPQRFAFKLPTLRVTPPTQEKNIHSELDQYLGSTPTMPLPFKLATSLPFNHYYQLYPKLIISPDGTKIFRQEPSEKDTLPGEPRIKLSDPRIGTYLLKQLSTPMLNKFHPYLWTSTSTKSTLPTITPLSEQSVLGRQIISTSNPELHLVHNHNLIYLSPIPKYLLSSSFWQYYIIYETSPLHDFEQTELREAATGFLRSYASLIQHRCDFNLAQSKGLIPKYVRYTEFIQFITSFENLPNSEVSRRYAFGELNLSSLNLWAPIALRKSCFHNDVRSIESLATRIYLPMFAVFVVLALSLLAMQVLLVASPGRKGKGFFEFIAGLVVFIGGVMVIFCILWSFWTVGKGSVDLVRDIVRRKKDSKGKESEDKVIV